MASKKRALPARPAKTRAAKLKPHAKSGTSADSSRSKPASSRPAPKQPPAKKARLISSRLSYQGKVFNVYTDTVTEPSGITSTRDIIRHSGSVVILAVDESRNPKDPDIIFERQYRHAAGQFLLELPAGRIEPGESPLVAAKREMIEETGFRARRWTLLTKYFASPGFLGEWMQIYLARDIREGAAQPEDDEQIETMRIPLSQALELIATNKIHDGKTMIGIFLYNAGRQAKRL